MLNSKWATALLLILIVVILLSFIHEEIMVGYEYVRSSFTSNVSIADPGDTEKTEPWAIINILPVASGFNAPVYLTNAADGSGRLFVVEKEGVIKIRKGGETLGEPFLDIRNLVGSKAYERGLLSMAFHPGYKENGRFFVNYTDKRGDTVIAEYRVGDHTDKALPESGRVLLKIEQPASNHNGGQINFGPGGYLYIGTGDGGSAGDPRGNAQDKGELLGKILRIDVDGKKPYEVPRTNPFTKDEGVKSEIWAYGLRNPWRFSFDLKTGDMYIADVGQNKWEWVHFQPVKSKGGENYGWNYLEGSHKFKVPDGFDTSSLELPVAEYSHDEGCSITGGYVYRGNKYPDLAGTYFFSDFCTGKIWGLRQNKSTWEWAEFLDTDLGVSSFGVDEDGEIYVLNLYDGSVHMLTEE